ncbi:MAG: ABC transporter ATP-binding protein [Brachymonas sp.]|nr:ABC transporter ATP-binding protein [Brachymonas sp.]
MTEFAIQVQSLGFSYKSRPVLQSVDFSLHYGEMLGILGPNGSGKTTLLKCLNHMLRPQQGEIHISGRNIRTMTPLEVARSIAYVPQQTFSHPSNLTVFEVVLMGRHPHHKWNSSQKDEEKTWKTLEQLQLAALAARPFSQLSGGQKQKVLIARALVQEAKILLLDEPTSSLDIKHQMQVMSILEHSISTQGIAACTIVHDLNLALRFCQNCLLLKNGQAFATGGSTQIINSQNIREVYEVDVALGHCHGQSHIVLL